MSSFGSVARPFLCRVGLALGLALGTTACHSSDTNSPEPGTPLALDLIYLPHSDADASDATGFTPVAPGVQVWVSTVEDARTAPNDIGFSEAGDNTPVVLGPGGQTPPDFVRSVVAKEMPVFGVPVAMDKGAATHMLKIQLLKFWVQEEGTYVGEVAVHAVLTNRAGDIAWEGNVTGVRKHWGKTFTIENFTNTFGSAAQDLGKKLALQTDVRKILAPGGDKLVPSSAPAPATAPAAATEPAATPAG